MIVVDAGHGGSDPGASGNGIIEKNYTLDISKYMADRFKELGVPVTLTRSTDETLTPEERVSRILNAYGNKPEVVVISNHLNSGGGDGAEAIYALRDKDTLSRIILEEIAKEGQNVRKWYQRRLPSDTSKDYYFIHRNTGLTEPVIVEYGFMDNPLDAELIKNHWRDLAEAVVRAVAIYKGIPYDKGIKVGYYIVQKGDSLWSIAKKFNVGVAELKTLNNMTTNTISIGQKLKIPGYVPPEQSKTTYVVQKGDSLWSIATAYKTTTDAIMKANGLTSTSLSIGQILNIPTPTVSPSGNTYTVASGDSLWSIANKFGVSVNELKNLNNLTSDVLSIGQTLIIPVTEPQAPTGTITYTVVSGDSLWTIANKFGVTVDELKNLNNLTTNTLSIGQTLIIPVTEPQIPTGTTTYTVASGDNLYSIADKYGVTVTEIKTANNLTTNTLSIGQTLIIPQSSSSPPSTTTKYIVVRGDSLYSIATKFGTTPEGLKNLNNLSSSLLSIGQELLVPATGSTGQTYVVRSGDSLWTIANKFGVTVNAIRIANGLTSDMLSIGQTIQIP